MVNLEGKISSSIILCIVEINPDLIFRDLNKLYNNVAILVLPFVHVMPTSLIFSEGLLKKLAEHIASESRVSLINT